MSTVVSILLVLFMLWCFISIGRIIRNDVQSQKKHII